MTALQNTLWAMGEVVMLVKSADEIKTLAQQADETMKKCQALSSQPRDCWDNYAIIYSRAAMIVQLSGGDPASYLRSAREKFAELQRLGASMLDAEQHMTLLALIEAKEKLRRKEDPTASLTELAAAAGRCFALSVEDARCRTLLAQGKWVEAEWLAQGSSPVLPRLQDALAKAQKATESPEKYPDAWQSLAETHLRLARASAQRPAARDKHVSDGLAAVEKIFAINKNHALGFATKGALLLFSAQTQKEPAARRSAAQSAAIALEQSLQKDSFLSHSYAPLLAQAKELVVAN